MSDNMRAIILPRASDTHWEPRRNESGNVLWTYREIYKNHKIKSLWDNKLERANILIVDEYRMVDQKILDDVLLPFLTNPRQPGFLSLPQYANNPMLKKKYIEENKEIEICLLTK